MTALLAKANPYLGIDELDMTKVYLLMAAIVVVFLIMVFVKLVTSFLEIRQSRKSSWLTFNKIARVKGLSNMEIQALVRLVAQSKQKRPAQIFGSIKLYDRIVDRAVDRGKISSNEQSILETVREKLQRAEVKWDGRTNRRQFERCDHEFSTQIFPISKQAIDDEVKSKYQETDPEFNNAISVLIVNILPVKSRVGNLGAGGLSLLISSNVKLKENDYVQFDNDIGESPFAIKGIIGRIIGVEPTETDDELVLHVCFLPFDPDVRRSVIKLVYEIKSGNSTKKDDSRLDHEIINEEKSAEIDLPNAEIDPKGAAA